MKSPFLLCDKIQIILQVVYCRAKIKKNSEFRRSDYYAQKKTGTS